MLDFIYNAYAGSGKGKKAMKAISEKLNELKIDFRTHLTLESKHAIRIAKELSASGATDIIAVGGDGTINEVLNGIDVEKVNFGIIPAGSGNDFASSAHISTKPLEALETIIHGTAKPTDFLDCSGVRGINIISTGIDVDILARCQRSKFFRGKIQYLLSLIITLFKFSFREFDVLLHGERVSKDGFIVCAGNGKMLGGGLKMCPNAEIDDGLIDFVVCRKVKKSKLPSALTNLLKGKLLEQSFTEFSREKEVEVCFDKLQTVDVDGELYENLPFDVKIIPNGVKLYRP